MTNIQYFPTEFDMGDFTDEQLESILIFLQMKYGDFRDKGDFGIERFILSLKPSSEIGIEKFMRIFNLEKLIRRSKTNEKKKIKEVV